MKITSFQIENFKSIKSTKLYLEHSLSVLTGINNSGKTTLLEALALWTECFEKLLHQSKRKVSGKYEAGDYVFGTGPKNYFDFSDINSVRSPNFEDIFYNRDVKKTIHLVAIIENEKKDQIEIGFTIANSTKSRYIINLENESSFDYAKFQSFFTKWPIPVKTYFSTPIANVVQQEAFVTEPVLREGLRLRRSYEYIRNRLYKLYHMGEVFSAFQEDLSYILYGPLVSSQLRFYSKSDVQHDTRVVITYTIGKETIEKDIALLGSGSLQSIEILLDLYHQVNGYHDLNIILLDEPDSHIHRDIQKRLFEVLNRMRQDRQIVITTHNESMIRTVPLTNLFHVDVTQRELHNIGGKELDKINQPHFRDLYPSQETPLIRDVTGETTGLDLISAIEADKIFFVEGDDDARLLYSLFRRNPANNNKKIMFWVLGGVSKILTKIDGYYDVFSSIRNGKSLWEKSNLIFDQDMLMDDHIDILQKRLLSKYHIKSFVAKAYTQESVLLTDFKILSSLLCINYQLDDIYVDLLSNALKKECSKIMSKPQTLESMECLLRQYEGTYIKPLNDIFCAGLKCDGIALSQELPEYLKKQPEYKLAKKDDVEAIINAAGNEIEQDFKFNIEKDFFSLVTNAKTGFMYDIWKNLIDFMSE